MRPYNRAAEVLKVKLVVTLYSPTPIVKMNITHPKIPATIFRSLTRERLTGSGYFVTGLNAGVEAEKKKMLSGIKIEWETRRPGPPLPPF